MTSMYLRQQLGNTKDCGCGCKGAGTCGDGMGHDGLSGIAELVSSHKTLALLAAVGAFILWRKRR